MGGNKMTRFAMVNIFFIVVSLMFVGISYAAINPENAAGIWLFDDSSGGTAVDSSGNGNDGTINGATIVDGKFSKALEFDGANVDCGNDASLDLTDAITIMAWAKLNKLNQNAAILEKRDCGAGGNGYALLNGWDRNTYMELTNFGFWIQGGVLEVDRWYHFVATWDSATGEASFYQDGTLAQSKNAAGTITVNTVSLLIGQRTGGCTGNFSGTIDEVAVFNASLTEDDVADIMTEGLSEALGMAAVSPSGKLATTWASIKK